MRLPTKPRQFPTKTPTLPSFFESCMQVAMTSLLVALPRTISSRRITFAGLKKCVPMTDCGTRSCGRNLVDVQRRSVAGKNGAGLANAVEFREDFFLERHAFKDGFDDDVGVRERIVGERRLNQFETLVDEGLCEAAAFHGCRIILLDVGEAPVERGLIGFLQNNGNAGVGKNHRDAASHRPRADDCSCVHRE